MTYSDLENITKNNYEVCLFGAGVFGKTRGYDLIKSFGLKVDFYCDNMVAPGTVIRDGIEVRDIQYLYNNKDNIQVFLTVTDKFQKQILDQMEEHNIHNVIIADWLLFSQVLESIEASGDEAVKQRYHVIYDDVEYLEKFFEQLAGYKPNINNPRTFNEKLQWLKLYDRKPEYVRMVDKYEAKQFAEEKIGGEYTSLTLGVWDSFDDIDFDKLPAQFVLKCTHDSGSIIVVENKDDFNKDEARKKLNKLLGINYFWESREWPYKNVKRKIIAEEYLSGPDEIADYKFYCFNGVPKIVSACTERWEAGGVKVTNFDLDWNRMNFERHKSSSKKKIERPQNLELMIRLAEKLSSGIPFVRVDFYGTKGQVYFGEMTFFPTGGMGKFRPAEWDEKFGDWITLPEKS